jgi:hypothetical protein
VEAHARVLRERRLAAGGSFTPPFHLNAEGGNGVANRLLGVLRAAASKRLPATGCGGRVAPTPVNMQHEREAHVQVSGNRLQLRGAVPQLRRAAGYGHSVQRAELAYPEYGQS